MELLDVFVSKYIVFFLTFIILRILCIFRIDYEVKFGSLLYETFKKQNCLI